MPENQVALKIRDAGNLKIESSNSDSGLSSKVPVIIRLDQPGWHKIKTTLAWPIREGYL